MAWIRTQDGALWDIIGAEIHQPVWNYGVRQAEIRVYGRTGAAAEDGIGAYTGQLEDVEMVLSSFVEWLSWHEKNLRHWSQIFDFGNGKWLQPGGGFENRSSM